jgi:polyvinyl alcohol dehydrogenase (cytochrome)
VRCASSSGEQHYSTSEDGRPSVVGGRVLLGGGDRKVHALDAKTGCIHWSFGTDAVVRTAVSVGPRRGGTGFAVYFGDVAAHACALDAATGRSCGRSRSSSTSRRG